jgi:two-component system NtrC family response regulator
MAENSILIVDDDSSQRRLVEFWLREDGYDSITAANGLEGLKSFEAHSPRLVIADIRMPGLSGTDLLSRIHDINPEIPVILVTAFGTVNSAVEAMKLGAADYLLKPLNAEELKIVVRRTLEHRKLIDENRYLREYAESSFGFENLIGRSHKMRELFDIATQVARHNSTVLLTGESGTGKELVAKAIHQNGPRRDKPFVTINCGAIPETLIESELFGHRKGSFTGATTDRAGKFEAANGGTIFLDEIGELQLSLQVKLLRVIQEREIDKIGHPHPIKVDVRILAATNRELRTLVEDGQFREDLYYRLSVVRLHVPPLRERKDDIPLLLEHFMAKYCTRHGVDPLSVTEEALEVLRHYNWPGNVRELENVVERLIVMGRNKLIRPEGLPAEMRAIKRRVANLRLELPEEGIDLEEVERDILVQALEKHKWNQTHAARYLNISRKTLIYRMEKFGLRPDGQEDGLDGTSSSNTD